MKPILTPTLTARRKQMLAQLTRARLWPVQHTRAYYRRVALRGSEALVRAVLRLIADQL